MSRGEKELEIFFGICKSKLAANEHKGSWEDQSVMGLCRWIRVEVKELEQACFDKRLKGNPPGEVAREAADVANLAMMVADIMGELDGGKEA